MKKILLYTAIVVLGHLYTSAQPSGKISKQEYVDAAVKAGESGNHFEAIELYTAAYNASKKTDVLPSLVKAYYKIRDYSQAIKWAKEYINQHDGKKDRDLRRHYAMALKSMGQYSEAIKHFKKLERYKFSDAVKSQLLVEKNGAEMAASATVPKGITVTNIGTPINKKGSEYAPFLAPDGSLYFAALTNEEILDAEDAGITSKIFRAQKTDAGYASPEALPTSINDPKHFQSNLSFSEDGKTMIFARQTISGEGKIESSRLFSSTMKSNGKWSSPKALYGIKKGVQFKSPSFGRYMDKDVVFFISNAKDSKGGYDIYYAPLRGDGKLGTAQNMGAVVNTTENEESPFYKDGILYFSSKGHAGFGGYDVFSVDVSGESLGTVSNMGLPYNSPADDLYFMMADNFEGMMVSNRSDGANLSLQSPTCCNDIYSVSLVNLQLETLVADADSGADIQDARITVKDASGAEITAIDNRYPLKPNTNYTIEISKEGYETAERAVTTENQWTSRTIKESIALIPIKVTPPPPAPEVVTVVEPIVLDEILFDYNDDKILPQAEGDLAYLQKIMTEYPDMKIRISSHTDDRGGKDYNQKLSQRRSDSVRNWLIRKGIDRTRIVAVGRGSERPLKAYAEVAKKYSFIPEGAILDPAFIAKLTKEQRDIARQLNRRSEFEILEGPKVIIKKK